MSVVDEVVGVVGFVVGVNVGEDVVGVVVGDDVVGVGGALVEVTESVNECIVLELGRLPERTIGLRGLVLGLCESRPVLEIVSIVHCQTYLSCPVRYIISCTLSMCVTS